MIKPKNINNEQSYDYMDNSFTQKKEEKSHSRVSFIEPVIQQLTNKSGISNKK